MPLKICLTKENTDTCGYRCFCQFPFFGRAVPADNLGTDSRAFIVTHPVSPDSLRSLPISVCRGVGIWLTPPSDEGGGFAVRRRRRERITKNGQNNSRFLSPSQKSKIFSSPLVRGGQGQLRCQALWQLPDKWRFDFSFDNLLSICYTKIKTLGGTQ